MTTSSPRSVVSKIFLYEIADFLPLLKICRKIRMGAKRRPFDIFYTAEITGFQRFLATPTGTRLLIVSPLRFVLVIIAR